MQALDNANIEQAQRSSTMTIPYKGRSRETIMITRSRHTMYVTIYAKRWAKILSFEVTFHR